MLDGRQLFQESRSKSKSPATLKRILECLSVQRFSRVAQKLPGLSRHHVFASSRRNLSLKRSCCCCSVLLDEIFVSLLLFEFTSTKTARACRNGEGGGGERGICSQTLGVRNVDEASAARGATCTVEVAF